MTALVLESSQDTVVKMSTTRAAQARSTNAIMYSCRQKTDDQHSLPAAKHTAEATGMSETKKECTRVRTIVQVHTQPSQQAIYPGIMQNPGIPAQQMQRTGTREWACGSGTGQKHSRSTRTTRRNLAASRGEAAERQRRKAAHIVLRASGRVPATGAPMSLLFN